MGLDATEPGRREGGGVERWLARGLGSLVALGWLVVGIASAVEGRTPWMWESAVLGLLVVAVVAGAVLAWRREGAGGAVLAIAGVAAALFTGLVAHRNRGLAMLFLGGPPLLAGLLFLASARRRR